MHDGAAQTTQQILKPLGLGVVSSRAGLDHIHRDQGEHVRIIEKAEGGLLRVFDRADVGIGRRRLRLLPSGETLNGVHVQPVQADGETVADFLFHQVRVHIADDDQHAALRRVIVPIICFQSFRRRGLDHLHRADGVTLGDDRVRIQEGVIRVEEAPDRRVAEALFAQDNAALAINRLAVEDHFRSGFTQQEQAHIQHVFGIAGQIQLIAHHFAPGEGVGVRTKRQPVTLQQRHHLAFRHVSGAVERHVLDEVRQTALIILFSQRPHIKHHAQGRRAGRGVVFQNRVAKPVLQHAIAHIGMRCDVAGFMRKARRFKSGGKLRLVFPALERSAIRASPQCCSSDWDQTPGETAWVELNHDQEPQFRACAN